MDAVPHQENETTQPTEGTTTSSATNSDAPLTQSDLAPDVTAEAALEPKTDDPAPTALEDVAAVVTQEAAPEPAEQSAQVKAEPEVVAESVAQEPVGVTEAVAVVEPVAVVEEPVVVDAPTATVTEEPAPVIAPKPSETARVTSEEQSTIVRTLKFKPAPEPRWRRVLEQQGYQAAGVIVALGAGWILGAHTFSTGPETREIIQALNAVTTRLEDVEHLTTRLNAQAQDVAAMKASIASLRSIADANRAEAQVSSAQLAVRVSNLPQPVQQDLTPILRRLEQLEAAQAQAVSQPVAQAVEERPAPVAAAVAPRVPADGYVLRRVSGNMAVIETGTGLRQVMVGDYLPGAGRVRRIERRNGQWLVFTSAGVIDSQSY